MLPIHDAMANNKKIIINAISFIDLQLKLAKHPRWRILEISRLNFSFEVVLQKKPQKTGGASLTMPLIEPNQ
jgi:hypothetical protein